MTLTHPDRGVFVPADDDSDDSTSKDTLRVSENTARCSDNAKARACPMLRLSLTNTPESDFQLDADAERRMRAALDGSVDPTLAAMTVTDIAAVLGLLSGVEYCKNDVNDRARFNVVEDGVPIAISTVTTLPTCFPEPCAYLHTTTESERHRMASVLLKPTRARLVRSVLAVSEPTRVTLVTPVPGTLDGSTETPMGAEEENARVNV